MKVKTNIKAGGTGINHNETLACGTAGRNTVKSHRLCIVVAILVLLGGRAPLCGQGRVLVPGDPPLTHDDMDLYRQAYEGMLDVEMTATERRQWQQLFIADWNKSTKVDKQQTLTGWKAAFKWFSDFPNMTEAQRKQLREANQPAYLAGLRKSSCESDRFLLAIYEAAYKPGGSKNPVLVGGEPPLSKILMDHRIQIMEWMLDLQMTDRQRQQYQQMFIQEWEKANKANKERFAKEIADWTHLRQQLRPDQRNILRITYLPHCLAIWSKKDGDAEDRWLFALYQAMSKPGSERNPVLGSGTPPLTQGLVDRYADYVEWVLDFSVSGGLTAAQRQVLQDYLVRDWKKMDREARDSLLGTIKHFTDAVQLSPTEASKWRSAQQAKLVAQLRVARDHERSQWLLEIHEQERQKFQAAWRMQELDHKTKMNIIDGFAPRWRYNPLTGRYEP